MYMPHASGCGSQWGQVRTLGASTCTWAWGLALGVLQKLSDQRSTAALRSPLPAIGLLR